MAISFKGMGRHLKYGNKPLNNTGVFPHYHVWDRWYYW